MRYRSIVVAAMICATAGFGALAAEAPSPRLPSLAPVVEKILPSIVSIFSYPRNARPADANDANPAEGRAPLRFSKGMFSASAFGSEGSGIIVDAARGLILTNAHLVEGADVIAVNLNDGRRLRAKMVGLDPPTDLAVVQIPAGRLTGARFGDSDALAVGDYVLAIGNPYALSQSVSLGIVSALGRNGLGIQGYEDFIQTDASINPGNSGGALVDLEGNVVGVNSAFLGPTGANIGIGLAIPSNVARVIMGELVANGQVKRGRLGVAIQDLTPDLARAMSLQGVKGVLVDDVVRDSPAEKVGVRSGDVITEVNGRAVAGVPAFHNAVGLAKADSLLPLVVYRDGASYHLTSALEEVKVETLPAPADIPALSGVVLSPMGGLSGADHANQGAVVVSVDAQTAAGLAGLKAGDVLVGVNQKTVRSPEEAFSFARESEHDLLLRILRNGRSLYLVVI